MSLRARKKQILLVGLGISITLAPGIGCKSDKSYHKDADKVAMEAIHAKQKETFGKEEPFTVETPAQTLRRRLMLDQKLQHSNDASVNIHDVQSIKDWPEGPTTRASTRPTTRNAGPLRMGIVDALQIGAANSREYQDQKDLIFIDALSVDLRWNEFRPILNGQVQGTIVDSHSTKSTTKPTRSGGSVSTSVDSNDVGIIGASKAGVSQQFANGLTLAGAMTFDVAKLLTGGKETAHAVGYDTSVSAQLLRGGGEYVVMEPVIQAERNLAYDLLNFQQYKRRFAVNVGQQYLNLLSQYDQIANAEAAYRRAITSTRRARRQADAGRLTEIDVDQSVSQELRSRDRWIQAQSTLVKRLDAFKLLLGLPTDAEIALDPADMKKLMDAINRFVQPETAAVASGATTVPTTQQVTDAMTEPLAPVEHSGGGLMDIREDQAIAMALKNRPDLQVRIGDVFDAQRKVRVAANALQAGLTLTGRAVGGGREGSILSARNPDVGVREDTNIYSGSLLLDLPLDRVAERNAYRISLLNLDGAARDQQQLEDQIKADVRADLADLLLASEEIRIQAKSVAVAQKRVNSTNLFLDAGRAQIRDVLDAQDTLVTAQNSLTSALISFRLAELSLQRDIGVLEVNSDGLWREYTPSALQEQKQ